MMLLSINGNIAKLQEVVKKKLTFSRETRVTFFFAPTGKT